MRGSHVGSYIPSSGVWHQTQRFLKKGSSNANIIHHLDFDAPTREHAHQLPDDKVLFCVIVISISLRPVYNLHCHHALLAVLTFKFYFLGKY